jgi:hypothetical protein
VNSDQDSFDVQSIDPLKRINGLGQFGSDGKKKKHPQQDHPEKEVRGFFNALSVAAEKSNNELIKKNLPYRFCVYEEAGEVFIDLVVLDENGKIVEEKKKNIGHQNFSRMIDDIAKSEGLFFDGMA